MKNAVVYLISMLFVVTLSSLALYDSEKMRSVRAALGIILLASFIIPFVNGFVSFSENLENILPEYGADHDIDLREELAEDAFLRGIKNAVADKFNVSEDDIRVNCSGFSFEKMRAEKINIILSGSAAFYDIRSIREYIEGSGFGECEVSVSFG